MDENTIPKPKRGRLRIFIYILLVISIIAGGALGGYLFWQQSQASSGEAPEPVVEKTEPIYLSLNTFTVSLKPTEDEADRVLYLGLTVSFNEQQSLALLQKFMPEYRSRLFMLLTQQTYAILSTDEGKSQLINNIKHELSQPLAHQQVITPDDVLINEFILR